MNNPVEQATKEMDTVVTCFASAFQTIGNYS